MMLKSKRLVHGADSLPKLEQDGILEVGGWLWGGGNESDQEGSQGGLNTTESASFVKSEVESPGKSHGGGKL